MACALLLIPYLIGTMGKDQWAKYSVGISFIFLSNYFSFGIGPTLNRRVSEWIGLNKINNIPGELKDCVRLSYILGISFFLVLQLGLYFAKHTGKLSVLRSSDDYIFFVLTVVNFLIVFCIIPFRSILESFSDFYFLAIIRAITAVMFFVLPVFFLWYFEEPLIPLALGFILFYMLLYLVFLKRVSQKALSFGVSLTHPVKYLGMRRLFKVQPAFLKETFYFSVFFLTSAIILFFDRFYYPLFYNTEIISDQVTLLDLFNRAAILTGTLSLVYFSATSVWYQEGNLTKIRSNLYLQIGAVLLIFITAMIISYLFLNDLLYLWLKNSYSEFIQDNSINLLLGVLLVNFTILFVRPLQAIGQIKLVSLILGLTTGIYIGIVIIIGYLKRIELHFVALTTKALLDCLLLGLLMKRKGII